MKPQEELQQLRDREEDLKQELKAKKKTLQEAQRRQRNTLTRQIRRAQARVSAADRKHRTRRLILLGAYLDRRMDTAAGLKAEVTASLNESLQHDRDRALFGDDLRPTSSDAPAAALDTDPQTPPTEGWTPRQLGPGGVGRGARRCAGGRSLRERPAARHANPRHRPTGRNLDHDRPGCRQPTRHPDRGHDKRPAAPVRPRREVSTAAGRGTRRAGAEDGVSRRRAWLERPELGGGHRYTLTESERSGGAQCADRQVPAGLGVVLIPPPSSAAAPRL